MSMLSPSEENQAQSSPRMLARLLFLLRKLRYMNFVINGEPQSFTSDTLGALVDELGMKADRVAIELNREIVPREQWPKTELHDGDRLEIVHFVGGGASPAPN